MARRGETPEPAVYRPIATEAADGIAVGERVSLYRGYLSRSAADDAGHRSGIPYEVEWSWPVEFPSQRDTKRDRLVDQLVVAVIDGLPEETVKALAMQIDERKVWQ